jgi:hypothetical protein
MLTSQRGSSYERPVVARNSPRSQTFPVWLRVVTVPQIPVPIVVTAQVPPAPERTEPSAKTLWTCLKVSAGLSARSRYQIPFRSGPASRR